MSGRNKFYFACIIIKSYRICERSIAGECQSRFYQPYLHKNWGEKTCGSSDAELFFSFLEKTEINEKYIWFLEQNCPKISYQSIKY